MKKVIVLMIGIMALCGCSTKKESNNLEKIMQENEYVIIDVRTKEEYDEEHVVEAINIPYDQIEEKIEIDKEIVIFVYCKSGNRSKQAFNTLTNLGYTVYDLGAISDINLPKE